MAYDIIEQDDDDHSNPSSPDILSPKITEAMEMMQRLRLLLTIQQSQLHKLISELESKLVDVYFDSKEEKNNYEGFF
jgi:hypothetical protein